MAVDERDVKGGAGVRQAGPRSRGLGEGLLKGLTVTLRTMMKPAVTQQYPEVKPDLPARTRGVIALKEANCTVCYKCSRACPDWCIYIDAHKETHEPASGGKGRSVKVLDRFAIDFSLCMYCGICVEVCPFDALFWSPEFEYAEYDIGSLTHEKEKLEDWTYLVLPPPELEVGAEAPPEVAAAGPQAAAPVDAGTPAARVASLPSAAGGLPGYAAPPSDATVATEAPAGTGAESGSAAGEAPARPARAPRVEVEPDQETYDRVLAEQLAKGSDRRIAEGRAKAAALKAARAKAEGSS